MPENETVLRAGIVAAAAAAAVGMGSAAAAAPATAPQQPAPVQVQLVDLSDVPLAALDTGDDSALSRVLDRVVAESSSGLRGKPWFQSVSPQ
ncbi:hypothetical protein GCM10010399_30880 [Dactylosporangium fulvum]|uniref:FxSxx-COOH protein n=1 Tax=Dactylosporangium fulvum TaxID=53359 RepID=A0ABY5W7D1_9ACTN|nr:FxSxx-COOH cyclophane-containing RiPP peptide [Dactylosporangium fulvum]UWP85359.1 FxSxx-COOH protein [Dactylosporangium fulvum]